MRTHRTRTRAPAAGGHNTAADFPVASLLPGLTDVLVDLRLAAHVVANSHECDLSSSTVTFPKLPGTPDLTSLEIASGWNAATAPHTSQFSPFCRHLLATRTCSFYHVNPEALARANPRVLLTHVAPSRSPLDPAEDDVQVALQRLLPRLEVIISANCRTLRDVFQLQLDVARALHRPAVAVLPVATARARLRSLQIRADAARLQKRPRLTVVQWADPLFLAGDWVPAVVRAAGGDPDGLTVEGSPSVAVEPAALLGVDVVVFALCAVDLKGCAKALEAFLEKHGSLFAGWKGSFVVTDATKLFSRPSLSAVAKSAEVLSDVVLDGNKFRYRGVLWDFWESPLEVFPFLMSASVQPRAPAEK